MQGNPLAQGSHTHQVLMGTGMPHAGCLQAQGSLMLGTFLGTGIPHRLNTLWAQGSPVPGAYRHGDPPCWALYGHRDLLCWVLHGHRGALTLSAGVPPLWVL